ncbi:NUDIX domain-containing protein [Candidatus Saccharibacteria bacterium]|nr:NUDIX domain-containing protein [Candidatus Saccharibacteria bacterium]
MLKLDDSPPRIIHKVALAHFKDGKIMVVRDNKNVEVFILPGGKIEEGETDIECLKREVQEELSVDVKPGSEKFLHAFIGPAHGKEGVKLDIRLYQADFIGEPAPTQEIVEIDYFDSSTDERKISEIGRTQILPWLKKHGYIN